jgi:hypothetical protein
MQREVYTFHPDTEHPAATLRRDDQRRITEAHNKMIARSGDAPRVYCEQCRIWIVWPTA